MHKSAENAAADISHPNVARSATLGWGTRRSRSADHIGRCNAGLRPGETAETAVAT